ncbi:MAG: CocE/NonD family hydrolase [Armatimonadota bacterium]|nr:CocE/NonD family hydrolase [Armatimonadota bacterium]
MTPAGLGRPVEVEVRHVLVPTRDGTRLSANLFRPVTEQRVPVAVEYTPYRKDDLRGAARDFGHFYLAERGIASVQLDVRGTGASDGFVTDEYQYPQEQQDGYDAIEWLACQDWCNGRAGMWGTSYAGFTALQVAQVQPPSLCAIAPIYATDDRYTDDMHFRGGALAGWSVIGPYALGMVSRNALPPHPDLAGDDWKAVWDQRLEQNIPWLIRWLDEQLDGAYWRSTLGRMYDRVTVPTLIIGGWADFYVNASLRWFANLKVPKKLIMGPWPHTPPDAATPGPRIDFMHEITRWFKQWLADEPTGVTDEPPVTVFIQHFRRPDAPTDVAPGVWRFEDTLPPARAGQRRWFFGARSDLTPSPPVAGFVVERSSVPFVGFADLGFAGGAVGWGEQAANEAFSIVFTSKPLAADTEILGSPQVSLFVSTTSEVAFVAVRLCDVAPDGASTLVCKGLLNATRRNGMDRAEPLTPGEVYALTFPLDAVSWVFPKGHRIRVAVSGADFPDVWPSPQRGVLRVHCGSSHQSNITLPVVPPARPRHPQPALLPPPPRRSRFEHAVERPAVTITYDVAHRTMTARRELCEVVRCPDGVTVVSSEHRTEMTVSATDPAAAGATAWDRKILRRPDLEVESTATAELKSTEREFHLDLELHVTFNGTPYRHRRWTRTIPRRLL